MLDDGVEGSSPTKVLVLTPRSLNLLLLAPWDESGKDRRLLELPEEFDGFCGLGDESVKWTSFELFDW